MEKILVRRNLEDVVKATLKDTPVTIIQGARQVGKSTLAMMASKDMKHREVSLDSREAFLAAKENPFEFVSQYKDGLFIIDEVQKCPDLLSAIKLSVDRDRRPGRFLITGSADILSVKGANESLAGRAETIWLKPFSVGETKGVKEDFVTRLLRDDIIGCLQKEKPLTRAEYAGLIISGGYPDAIDRVEQRRRAYFKNYISRVLDHDANELSGLAHLDRLRKLYDIMIGATSGIYVKANIARLIGIPESSMDGYIRLLEDLCLLYTLPAWGNNYSRRAISKPKIIVSDTGLACSLKGTNHQFISSIENGAELGPLLETFVIAEISKQQSWSKTGYSMFHYRDRDNKEVDIVLELEDGRLIAIEIKAASSYSRKDFGGMKTLRDAVGDRFYCGIMLYTGTEAQPFGDRMFAAPISAIWQTS